MISNGFLRLNWISLVLIYLVVIAGSVVRTTGSGMGCPDWPRCFGEWVPPTNADQLPDNYREIYGEQRVKKVEKFARFLTAIGMKETAGKIRKDPATYEELPFNPQKTWTEYINRLVGFLAGNAVLAVFIWALVRYRRNRKLVIIATVNLVVLAVQAWFGSIVVATNLVPWTITVHMLLALVIIGLQLWIIRISESADAAQKILSKPIRQLMWLVFLITAYQMFLGTQVREYIDQLTRQGLDRDSWTEHLGMAFFIHRSFSWLVLVLMTVMLWLNWKGPKQQAVFVLYGVLVIELISGVLLAWADMPGLVQVSHLLCASVLFGMMLYALMPKRGLQSV